ncbi:iron ABC transporter permease, partial [Mesorhizobium sp. M00.F.Ca.ET.186.01.1.1]
MRDNRSRFRLVLTVNIILIVLAIYISITNGVFDMSVMDVIRTLLRLGSSPEQ